MLPIRQCVANELPLFLGIRIHFTRRNDKYFGQWLVLNVPFRDVRELVRNQRPFEPTPPARAC